MQWWILSMRIGAFGFLKEYRPEDPYITQYLVGPTMNLTEEQVNQEIFPVATYVGLVLIVLVFLLTDFLCYKPIIVLNALSGVISQAFLIWGRGVRAMQVMEFFYATMTACEVAYYTYIYAKVDREHYQKVTSHMRAAALTGRFTSATTSQLVLSLGILTIADLNHLTFAGMCCAFLCALSLPSMNHSLYFHRKTEEIKAQDYNSAGNYLAIDQSPNSENDESDPRLSSEKVYSSEQVPITQSKYKQAGILLWRDFKAAYSNHYVLTFCIWVALATCGFNQMMTYVQILWVKIGGKQQVAYNGAVEAVYTITSAVSALLFGQVQADWGRWGEPVLGLLTVVQGASLVFSSQSDSMIVAYATYILFGMFYNIMLVMANSEIARYLNKDSYALIFGVNTFVSLILQTVLTLTVAGEGGFEIPIRDQFVVYGSYFIVLGGIFLIKSVFTSCLRR